MPIPSDNHEFTPSPEVDGNEDLYKTIPPERVDLNQVYTLVDSILPFEACLYYQVLPLFIEGSRLTIGMVNLDDLAASEYVKKQLSYINYSLAFRKIQSEWHRELLSKYLSHNAQEQKNNPPLKPKQSQSKASAAPTASAAAPTPPKKAKPIDERDLQATFIVDQPDQIDEDVMSAPPAAKSTPASGPASQPSPQSVSASASSAPTKSDATSMPAVGSPSSKVAPLHLQIDEQYRHISEEKLATLQPKPLMQVLLNKVLEEGIGRLYFERRADSGRILWSKDGVLQSVLEFVNPQIFQGVINEFKLLTHLSLIATRKTRQVEIERLYQNQRLLLRFRVMPNAHGEEATLQVLRGTALRFYQQQQIDKLGRDALDTAQRLQYRLNEIRDRARQSLNFKSTRSETLPAIIQLLKQMEAQVQEIVMSYEQEEANDTPDKPAS